MYFTNKHVDFKLYYTSYKDNKLNKHIKKKPNKKRNK